MRRPIRGLVAFGLLVVLAASSSCRNPQADAAIYQQLNDAAEQFASLRQEIGYTSDRLDSLRGVIAKQDTIIRKLANLAGLPIPPGLDRH